MDRRRVLIVGMTDSVHLARWLEHFTAEPIDFLLFSSGPNRRVHVQILKLLASTENATFRLWYRTSASSLAVWMLDRIAGTSFLRAVLLRRAVNEFKPHIVHALELQQAGYVLLAACDRMSSRNFTTIITNYGSDIFFFMRKEKHLKRIRALLEVADRYAAECRRDVELALSLGFAGDVMPVYPNNGGFSFSELSGQLIGFDDRRLLVVKGYHGWSGRALVALAALARMREQIKGYQVVVIQTDLIVRIFALVLRSFLVLDVRTYKKGSLPREMVLDLYDHAVAYVGLSVTDGISTSMLEAMSRGAIPVQTSTACCDEWFSETGVSVKELSHVTVSEAIQRAIEIARSPANLLRNRETIARKAFAEDVRRAARRYYL